MGDGFQLPSLHAELVPHPHNMVRLALLLLLVGEELGHLLPSYNLVQSSPPSY